jgi:hypothetical protein
VVVLVVLCVANAVIDETGLPLRAIRETTLDQLQCLFQWDFRCRGQQQMEVLEHDYKFMQQKPTPSTILRKNIN